MTNMSKKMFTKVGTSTLATLLAVGAPVSVMATPKSDTAEDAVDEIVLNEEPSAEESEAVASLLQMESKAEETDSKHDQLVAVHFVTGWDNAAKSDVKRGGTFKATKPSELGTSDAVAEAVYQRQAQEVNGVTQQAAVWTVYYKKDAQKLEKLPEINVFDGDTFNGFSDASGETVTTETVPENGAVYFANYTSNVTYEYNSMIQEMIDREASTSSVIWELNPSMGAFGITEMNGAVDSTMSYEKDRLFVEYDNTAEAFGAPEVIAQDGYTFLGWFKEGTFQENTDGQFDEKNVADGDVYVARFEETKVEVDKTELRKALDEAGQLKYDEYTEESWVPFGQAIADGEAVYADETATQEAVDKAIVALQNAKEGLVKKDAEKPEESVIYTYKVSKPDGTKFTMQMKDSTKVQSLLDKLTSIGVDCSEKDVTLQVGDEEAVALDTSMTVKEWMDMMGEQTMMVTWKDSAGKITLKCELGVLEGEHTFSMKFSKENPEEKVDKTALKAAIDDAKTLQEADYTKETWKSFADALKHAESVFNDTAATQKSVDVAGKDLTDAQSALQKIVVKDELQKAVDAAKKLKESDYTADSWKDFAKALDAATDVLLDNGATQEDVDNAVKALDTATKALVKNDISKVDKSKLAKAIEDAKSLKEQDYTKESWDKFADALAKAESVNADKDVTQETVDNAVKDLADAKAGLVKAGEAEKVDKTALKAAIAEAEKLNADEYTKDSWMAFELALKDAKSVYADEKATQDFVDKAVADLAKATEGLVKAGDEKPEDAVKFTLNIQYPGKNIGAKEFDSKMTVAEMKTALSELGIDCSGVKAQQIGLKTPNSPLKDDNTLNAIAKLVESNSEVVIQGYADDACKEAVGHLIRLTSSGENTFTVVFEEKTDNGDDGQKPNDGQNPDDENKDPSNEEDKNAKKYTLKVSTVDGKTFDAQVNDTSTIADLMKKFAEQGVNCGTVAKVTMKQANTEEVSFDTSKTVKDVVALLSKGDVQLIGYGEDGKALGCAVISATDKSEVLKVVFSKDTNVTLRTAEDIKDGKGKGEGVSQEGKGDGVAPSVQTADSGAIVVYSVAAGLLVLSIGGYVVYTKKLRRD